MSLSSPDNESERHLALRAVSQQNEDQKRRIEPAENINVSEIRKRLFDARLGGYCTGGDHKIQLQAKKLFNTENVLLYSSPSVVHLLRNLRLSILDVFRTKRFMYRYARELGMPKGDFRVGAPWASINVSRDWPGVFESTHFGAELSRKTRRPSKPNRRHFGSKRREPVPKKSWDLMGK